MKFAGLWLLYAALFGAVGWLSGGLLAGAGLIASGHARGNLLIIALDQMFARHGVSTGLGPFLSELPSFGLVFGVALAGLLAARQAYAIPAIAWVRADGQARWRRLWAAWLLGLALFALLSLVEAVLVGFDPDTGWLRSGPGEALLAVVGFAAVGLVWAGAEEVIVRGLILRHLQRIVGLAGAVVVSSLIFWLAHRDFSLGGGTALLAMGLACAWIVIRTGGLEGAIGVHAANNLVADLAANQVPAGISAEVLTAFSGLASAAIMVVIGEVIRRRWPPPRSTAAAAPAP